MDKITSIQTWWMDIRKEVGKKVYHTPSEQGTIKDSFLEGIFQPPNPEVPGKGPMDMLHPNIKKLHLPHGMYIADWRKYRVDDHPELIAFQKRCHAAGLHDPWLRNYAWRYYPNCRAYKTGMGMAMDGCLTGLLVASAWIVGVKLFWPGDDHHHDGHHEHKEELSS